MSDNKKIHIISGGTISPIATHLALCAPAYGAVGAILEQLSAQVMPNLAIHTHFTKMAGGGHQAPNTNDDIAKLVAELVDDPTTKIVFMPVALCDFVATDYSYPEPGNTAYTAATGEIYINGGVAGKDAKRLKTSNGMHKITITPAPKIIQTIRQTRKDIFLVGFKTTDGVSEKDQYIAGLNLLKESSCNLVLANDVKTRLNMVITPEEARYHVTTDRTEALSGLVEMTYLRSHLTFTRSTVIAGESIPWDSDLVPSALRTVVNYCIANNAYKPFRGATVGHFAAKLSEDTFITSKRKTNFNDLDKIGLVKIKTDGPDTVLAYGAKPSVGGQSQRIIFSEHPEYDCVAHFHSPLKHANAVLEDGECNMCNGSTMERDHSASGCPGPIPVVSQRSVECGSHQCGKQTSGSLKKIGNLSVVYLENHGPNIVFHHSIDPQEVIDFIEKNFDLSAKTGGYVS